MKPKKAIEKCDICGRKSTDDWHINCAIRPRYIELKGHQKCLENVNNLVVIPNRIIQYFQERRIKKKRKK